jgi:hypothetical protein
LDRRSRVHHLRPLRPAAPLDKWTVLAAAAALGIGPGQLVALAGVVTVTDLNATWQPHHITDASIALVGSSALTGTPDISAATITLPPLDISAVPADALCSVRIDNLAPDASAVVLLEDSVDDFNNAVGRYLLNIKGGTHNARTSAKLASNRFGVTDAKMRARVLEVSEGAGLQLSAWLST